MTARAGNTAFTLIELLMVMGIVVLLIGLITAGASGFHDGAMRKQAHTQTLELATAIKDYKLAYGTWPAQTQGATDTIVEAASVISALTDNPRNIQFLGLTLRNGTNSFLDPWNKPFVVATDANGDGFVTMSLSSTNIIVTNETVAVLSCGKDPTKTNDWICSWK